jgi:CRISPR-associated protein Csx1
MSSGSKTPKALVIGVWGDPSRWEGVEYRISIPSISNKNVTHLAQKRYGVSEWGIKTRSSTLALTCFFSGFAETRTIIIGLDSLADLSSPSCRDVGIRSCAESRYREFIRKFIAEMDKSTCDLSSYENFIDLIMVPARGTFRGYTFRGSPIHIFNKVFIKVMNVVEELKPRFIVLDVTHGINYQTIASHYAVLGVVKLVNALRRVRREKEASLIILNSEPIPPPKQKEIKQEEATKTVDTPQLSILDVSEIENALNFINDLSSIISFRLPVSGSLPEGEGGEGIALQKLAKFVFLVESGAAGLTFPGAVDEGGAPLAMDICSLQVSGPEPNVKYPPQLIGNAITYLEASTQPVVLYSLHKAVIGLQQKLCSAELRADLVKYMNSVGDVLRGARLPHLHHIVTKESAKFSIVQTALKRLTTECWQVLEEIAKERKDINVLKLVSVERNEIEVSGELLKTLRMLESDVVTKCNCRDLVMEVINIISSEKEKKKRVSCATQTPSDTHQQVDEEQKKRCSASDEMIRNMIAHAGLSYDFIEKVVFSGDSYRITKVVYRRCLVEDFMESLQKMLKE